MGNFFTQEPPPPLVLVPPLFDFPPLAARNRTMFRNLAELVQICLSQLGSASCWVDGCKRIRFRNLLGSTWTNQCQLGDLENPHTFMDLFVSNSERLRWRSCYYYPKYGMGGFAILPLLPLLKMKRLPPEDSGIFGLRYGSTNMSIGATFMPFTSAAFPRSSWIVCRMGKLSAGVQYEPLVGRTNDAAFKNLANWSYAIGYGSVSSSPLSPSFNFGLELAKNSKLIASFYQHFVVQRRVKNPFEEDQIVGITNYIDFGFELDTRINGADSSDNNKESVFQVAAAWQANKNFLLKGKLGPSTSSLALAFKSWWKPSLTFNISAVRDRIAGKTAFGFGIRIEDLREASYQRADPNYVMLTPSKEHLAEGVLRDFGKRPMLQSQINSGNFDNLPKELRPIGKIL